MHSDSRPAAAWRRRGRATRLGATLLAGIGIGLLAPLGAALLAPARTAPLPVAPAPAPLCDAGADPLAGVYEPGRLEVREDCAYVTGVVEHVALMPDGDYHVRLRPDPRFSHAVNDQNRRLQDGNLVVEMIPPAQRALPEPQVGERVMVSGPWVLDTGHGWMEIHPVRYWIPLRSWRGQCQPADGAAASTGACSGARAEAGEAGEAAAVEAGAE